MIDRGHFDDIFKYISTVTGDQSLASNIVETLKNGDFRTLESLLNEKKFLDSCTDVPPSEYYNENWRKKAHLQITIKEQELYFEFVFSKTPDCLKIVTAYPDRRKRGNFFYQPVFC